eukprot:3522259-Prymnesium_polylepis.2
MTRARIVRGTTTEHCAAERVVVPSAAAPRHTAAPPPHRTARQEAPHHGGAAAQGERALAPRDDQSADGPDQAVGGELQRQGARATRTIAPR